jgi:hypothetical protein
VVFRGWLLQDDDAELTGGDKGHIACIIELENHVLMSFAIAILLVAVHSSNLRSTPPNANQNLPMKEIHARSRDLDATLNMYPCYHLRAPDVASHSYASTCKNGRLRKVVSSESGLFDKPCNK